MHGAHRALALGGIAIAAALTLWSAVATLLSDDPQLVLLWLPFFVAAALPMAAWMLGRDWITAARRSALFLVVLGGALVVLGSEWTLVIPGALLVPAALASSST